MKISQEELKQLVDAAIDIKKHCYAPYSNFRVGAALLGEDGKIYTGVNVENCSYGLTICAERTAYTKAVSEGCKKFKAIVVSSDVEDKFITPCGACRQFAIEFGDFDVVCVKPDRTMSASTTLEMLPGFFLELPKDSAKN
ncbi:hypothetical protein CYY_002501 [Polysphondylium violaceum]|uniref:Cytidine deaminase n=1 Tax=Polysphondylium violaceum TaxID=133409 RepID=A0A8J4UV32_9MYCE|nr:hypothetical protein CYY_002501 [Polysphondylium violaceum]